MTTIHDDRSNALQKAFTYVLAGLTADLHVILKQKYPEIT